VQLYLSDCFLIESVHDLISSLPLIKGNESNRSMAVGKLLIPIHHLLMIVYLGHRVWSHIIIGFSKSEPIEVCYDMSRLHLGIYGIIGRHLFLDWEESLPWRVSKDVRRVEGLEVGQRLWVIV
jgi:hypothetical protein